MLIEQLEALADRKQFERLQRRNCAAALLQAMLMQTLKVYTGHSFRTLHGSIIS
jgi:hypothetical protein